MITGTGISGRDPIKEKQDWLKSREKMAEENHNLKCDYCGVWSGVYRITLKKFHLTKCKRKVYLCQRHCDKVQELDDLIWITEHPEASGYTDALQRLEKKNRIIKIRKYASILLILIVIAIFTFILWG